MSLRTLKRLLRATDGPGPSVTVDPELLREYGVDARVDEAVATPATA